MSIRDIIEKWHLISTNYARHGYSAVVRGRDFEEMRDEFASALEEHSIMEAVCEAAKAVAADYEKQPDDCDAVELTAMYQRLASAISALQAYRKERGL